MRSAPRPPLVPGWPGLGNALDLARDPLQFFVRAYHQFGPVYRARLLRREITVLAGLEANLFMARQGDRVLGSQELFGDFAREMETEIFLVAMDGSGHRHLRKEMRAGYSREAFWRRAPEAAQMVAAEARGWAVGQRVPVTRTLQRLIARQLGLATTNSNPEPYFDDLWLFLNTIMNVCVMKTWPRLLLRRPAYRRARARVVDMARDILARHRAAPPAGREPDLIDDLLAATTEDGRPLSEPALIAATIGPLIAGIDTAANTAAFMLYALLKHPEALERVTAEVEAAFGEGLPRPEAFRAMPALHAAALETLRMYPVAFAVPRTAVAPFQFEGYTIEPGTEVFVASGVPHYLPEFYPRPQAFDLDRFAPPRQEHRRPGAFAPYGLGAHTCLGAGVAEAQIMLTLGVLLRSVRLQLDPPDYDLKVNVSPLPSPAPSFRVRVREQRR